MRSNGDLSHVIVAVRDLEKAQLFFSELLGAKFGEVGIHSQLGIRSVMSDAGVELLSPISPESDVAKFISKRGEGVYAVVFSTPDVRGAKAKVANMGIRVTTDTTETDLLSNEPGVPGLKEVWLHPKDVFGMCTLFVQFNE